MHPFRCPDLKNIPLSAVLHALSDPLRLDMVRALACGERRMNCTQAAAATGEQPSPSTCNHHLRILREAGLIESTREGVQVVNRLRRAEVDKRFPGLLETVLRQK